jgi:hypothetical protein
MRALLLLVVVPLWGAEDVTAILHRLVEAEQNNAKAAQQYTYVEDFARFRFDKDGQPRQTESNTSEVIFVEGLAYRKLVARDGKPLSPREQAQVEKQMQQTAAERRKTQRRVSAGGSIGVRGLFGSKTMDFGSLSEILVLFENRIAGEDEIRGHKTWVIECAPEELPGQPSAHEKQVRSWRKKLWVDQKDGVLVRAMYTVVARDAILVPGSSFTFDYDKIDADVWEPVMVVGEAWHADGKLFKPEDRLVFRMDRFQKFDVQSTITVK